MKITDKTKQKMAKQRLRRIKSYYNAYDKGYDLYNDKFEKYVVTVKKELNGQYYLIVRNKFGALSLQKLVYNGWVRMVPVSREGRQYAENKSIFDSWFKEAQDEVNRRILSYYNFAPRHVYINSNKDINEKYKVVLKKQFNDNYYFVLQSESGKYIVTQIVLYEDFNVLVVTKKEFDKYKTIFVSWINEARRTFD